MIIFKYGDVLKVFKEIDDKVILLHGCNCFHTMGAGIAKQIADAYPAAPQADIEQTVHGSHNKLGKYSIAIISTDGHGKPKKIIANGYTQYHYGRGGNLFIESALTELIMRLAKDYPEHKIMMPYIGAGLAGGTKTDTRAAISLAFERITDRRVSKDSWSDVPEPVVWLFDKEEPKQE